MTTIEFLKAFHPAGPWVLTAITPDGKKIETKTFGPKSVASAEKWIGKHNGERNLYFSVNLPNRKLDKKASRAEIHSVQWLHVDIDARAGEELPDELERIRMLLTERCPTLPPTVIVFSGGGYQAFWRLTEPIIIGGQLAAAEDITRYIKQLEIELGGDSCSNVDRIMRLPNTMNLPSAKKVERGRVPALAEVYEFTHERAYLLSDFPQVEKTWTKAITHNEVRRIESIDDLDRWAVPERIKIIIVQGHDPDNPKPGDNSRSVWLYDVVCNLVRNGVPDELIQGIILDQDLRISDSVLEKRKNAKVYAHRQVLKAHGDVNDDPVAWVNARYFGAREGGKVAFYREEEDGSIEAMQPRAFDFELQPKKAKIGEKRIPYSAIWKASSERRYYRRGFALCPFKTPEDYYNLWRGFHVDPVPGSWELMKEHIYQVLAEGKEEYADYIIRWTAWTIQNPHIPARVALVFRSDEEGVGKGTFCNALVDLFGSHGLRIQHMSHLTGKFNAHLRHCCLLFADEAITAGADGEGMLKGYITEPTIPIERKGVDVVQAENHLHIVMSSNSQWVVPAGPTARRFAVFNVSPCRRGDSNYFEKLHGENSLPGMLHDLLELDLGRWNPEANRPDTTALSHQKAASLPPVEGTLFDFLCSGVIPFGSGDSIGDSIGESIRVSTLAMRDHSREFTRRTDISFNNVSDIFKRLNFEQQTKSRPRGFIIPPLAEARQAWNKAYFPWAWGDEEEWQCNVF